jgi:hypothetical protein
VSTDDNGDWLYCDEPGCWEKIPLELDATLCPKHDPLVQAAIIAARLVEIICEQDRQLRARKLGARLDPRRMVSEADLRAQIAKDIEAAKADVEWPNFHWESGIIVGLERAAAIARGDV